MNTLNLIIYLCCFVLLSCPVKELLNSNEAAQTETITSTSAPLEDSNVQEYVLNINTDRFHKPTCNNVQDIKEKNKRLYTGTREDLIYLGFTPCGNCDP